MLRRLARLVWEIVKPEQGDDVAESAARPLDLRAMAANPLAPALILEAIDILVEQGMDFQALTLAYLEASLLCPDPNALRVALRNAQLLIPPEALTAFGRSMQAALDVNDANVLVAGMLNDVDPPWVAEMQRRD